MTEEETRAGANPAEQTPASPILLPEEVGDPDITEKLLNAQLAECLALMRDAIFLYRVGGQYAPIEREHFVDQTVNLMKASSEMGAMIHRLRNGDPKPPELVQRYVVERIVRGAPEGEGVLAIPKND